MAFVDLARNTLVLKVILTGPPAVGKTERVLQLGDAGRLEEFGTSQMGRTMMASLPLTSDVEGRAAQIEVYERHGHEKADIRAKGIFVGLDGFVYMVDAREDRHVDSVGQFEFLKETAGKTKINRLSALLLLGRMDEGLLRLSSFEDELQGPTWSERLELPWDAAEPFVEAVRLYGEVMLARRL